jgi:cation diffusion facilitator family transporter
MITSAAKQNIFIQRWVVVIAIVVLAIKLSAYFITHSIAILTDGLEGLVNMTAGLFGLYSLTLAAKPRDAEHPYGHGKIEFISAGVEGTLILLAGIFIVYEAILSLYHQRVLHQLDIGLLLIAVAAIINYLVGFYCVRIGTSNNSIALTASGKHLQSDAWTTLGVVVGLVIVYLTRILWLDSVFAILFAGVIVFTGYKIVRSAVAGIMDQSDRALLAQMVNLLNVHRKENWIDLHNVRIIKFGSILHLDAHVTVPWFLNVHEAHREIDALADLTRREFGETLELFVHSDGCIPSSCTICSKNECHVRQHAFEKKITWTVSNVVSNEKHNLTTDQVR